MKKNNEDGKLAAAKAALAYLEDKHIIGVGTGSTVNHFIDQLASMKHHLEGCIASSKATEIRLRNAKIPVLDLNEVNELPIYVDGADEVTPQREMIKGGGGALTREKIIATVAKEFICIVDSKKLVEQLGLFPIALEVLPIARSYVGRELVKLGGDPCYREGFITDNGNCILDVYNLELSDPKKMEEFIQLIPGVVECGLFAKRPAETVIVGDAKMVQIL